MRAQSKQKTKLEELDEKLQAINKKLTIAYASNMSFGIIQQLENLAQEIRFEMYNESELEKHRRSQQDGDNDESFIV